MLVVHPERTGCCEETVLPGRLVQEHLAEKPDGKAVILCLLLFHHPAEHNTINFLGLIVSSAN